MSSIVVNKLRFTFIHLQDMNSVSNLQGKLHVLNGIIIIDGWGSREKNTKNKNKSTERITRKKKRVHDRWHIFLKF